MPIIDILKPQGRALFAEYQEKGIAPLAYEVCWSEYTPEVEACMREVLASGSKLWVNSLWPSLCGGLCDDAAFDGDPAATKMNVVIPTILPIAVGTDGTVTTATDIRITNNSFGAVKVDNVKVEAGTGWKLTAFGSKDSLAKVKVDSNMIGFKLALGGGAEQLTNAENAASQTLIDGAIEGCYMSGNGDQSANSIGIAYDAIVSPVSEAVVNASVASVLFVICWDAV